MPSLLPLLAEYMAIAPAVAAPLQLEAVRGAVLLSDLFRDRAQFDWLARTLQKATSGLDAPDDPAMTGWLFLGQCKVRRCECSPSKQACPQRGLANHDACD